MTNISNMEQLEAIPIDHAVRVDGVDWLRTEKGLSHDGVDLALFHFEGRVVNGAVIDTQSLTPEAGEWWAGSSRTYYLTRVTERRLYYVSWRGATLYNMNGSSTRTAWSNSATVHRLTGAPSELANTGAAEWVTRIGQLTNELHAAQTERDVAVRERTTMQVQAREQARKPDQIRNLVASIRANLDQIARLMEE